MFGTKVIVAAIKHAEKEYPKESCGLVVDGVYRPYTNSAEDPLHDFRISPQGYAGAMRAGTIQAVIHSHPEGQDCPSENDMAHQMASNLPWCIIPFVVSSGNAIVSKPFWFGDQCPTQPLLRRQFRHGVLDCYSIIRDWFKLKRDIQLVDCAREDEWWLHGKNYYLDKFKEAGFAQIDLYDVERDDVILAQIASPVPNHAAIYLGNNLIIHHLVNRLSAREPASRWQKFFTHALRFVG